jgi:hypothetical protein
MKCDKGHEAIQTKGAIIDGKFGHYCPPHIQSAQRTAGANAAQYHRDREREDFRKELIQPKDQRTGKINPEFVKAYPQESREMFTEADMKRALRDT